MRYHVKTFISGIPGVIRTIWYITRHILIKVIFYQKKVQRSMTFLHFGPYLRYETSDIYSKPYIFRILMIRRTRWHAFQLDWSKLIFRSLYKSAIFKFKMAAIYATEKNGDNSILVGEGLKTQNSHKNQTEARQFARALF